jgi:folate-binding protein YgfZ
MHPEPLTAEARAAFDALATGAVVLPRTDVQLLEFTGPRAGEVLTGLVTSDVLALAPGASQYAAVLTPKGKVIADLRISRLAAERFLTTATLPCGPAWADLVRKYVNPRLARYAVPPLAVITCLGPGAAAALARAGAAGGGWPGGASPGDGSPASDGPPVLPNTEFGVAPAFDVLLPPAEADALLAALRADARVTPGVPEALEVARIAAGRPRCGTDMDDTTIPQEANLGDFGALSFSKGCYTGQETVARLHFRGHVNRSLRRVRAAQPFPPGATLRTADGKVVGDVRSAAISPVDGPLGLAMVRREVTAGATVTAHWDDAPPVELQVLT